MKVRIKVRPTGLINGQYWPQVGETIDLPRDIALGMLKAQQVELPGAGEEEQRPAPQEQVQTATAKRGRARDAAKDAAKEPGTPENPAPDGTGDAGAGKSAPPTGDTQE